MVHTFHRRAGDISFVRHYSIVPGYPGNIPLDADLSLPKRWFTNLLCCLRA
jgi:hypothetical protein